MTVVPCSLDPGLCLPATWQPPSPDPWQTYLRAPRGPIPASHAQVLLHAAAIALVAVVVISVRVWWLRLPRGRFERSC